MASLPQRVAELYLDAVGRPVLKPDVLTPDGEEAIRCRIHIWMGVRGKQVQTFRNQLPVPLPRPLTCSQASTVLGKRPLVTPKADGTLYALALFREDQYDVCLLVNRGFAVSCVEVVVPRQMYQGTLIFVELVQKNDGTFAFYAFDAAMVNGRSLKRRGAPIDERRRAIAEAIEWSGGQFLIPVNLPETEVPSHDGSSPTIPVILKSEGATTDVYPTDGIVLYDREAGIGVGRQTCIWRVKDRETLDLGWREDQWWMARDGALVPLPDHVKVCGPPPVHQSSTFLLVVECKVTVDESRQRVTCHPSVVRHDKLEPNDCSTLEAMLKETVTLEGVLVALGRV